MKLDRREMIMGAIAVGLLPTSVQSETLTMLGGRAFGSGWRIVLGPDAEGEAIRRLVLPILETVDATMSPYRETSQLSVFNASRKTGWQTVPEPLCTVAASALAIARQSEGWFDPTVGPVVNRFGFGPITGGQGHIDQFEVRSGSLRKAAPDLTLDLCGIAKGFALDRIIEALADHGVQSALVEIGGEVRAIGRHPDGRGWRVAVADPRSTGTVAWRIVAPGQMALATSGHATQGLSGPISTTHIIDPVKRAPTSTRLLSVSVLSETAITADALATALAAAGPRDGIALAQSLDIPALFVTDDPAGPLETMTGRFRRTLVN